jgi:hypothetical protein
MSRFKTLVHEYKSSHDVAEMFGVFLYMDEHPNIIKVLRDADCWRAFNKITGKDFAVFSIRPAQGEHSSPKFPGGSMSMMVPIWVEPEENREIIELFELESTQNLPMVLLFTEVNGAYLSIQLPIKDSTFDMAYNSVREQLEFSVGAISGVKRENLNSPEGLYAALSLRQDDRLKWKFFRQGVGLYKFLKDLKP